MENTVHRRTVVPVASKQQLEELALQDEKHSPLGRPYVITDTAGRIGRKFSSITSCSSNGSVANDGGSDRFGVVLKLLPCVRLKKFNPV